MIDVPVSVGFLGVLDATDHLADCMWSGLQRPVPLETIKRKERRLRLRYGPWRAEAGKRLRSAAADGELPVYLTTHATNESGHGQTAEPLQLQPDVLARLRTSRGKLTDRPIHPTLKIAGGSQALLANLTNEYLVLRIREFQAWLRRERKRGAWPSQASKLGRRVGRPMKQSAGLRSAVEALVFHQEWRGQDGIAKLHRLLTDSGRAGVPGRDTVGRLVTRLYRETGDPSLNRKFRARRKVR